MSTILDEPVTAMLQVRNDTELITAGFNSFDLTPDRPRFADPRVEKTFSLYGHQVVPAKTPVRS